MLDKFLKFPLIVYRIYPIIDDDIISRNNFDDEAFLVIVSDKDIKEFFTFMKYYLSDKYNKDGDYIETSMSGSHEKYYYFEHRERIKSEFTGRFYDDLHEMWENEKDIIMEYERENSDYFDEEKNEIVDYKDFVNYPSKNFYYSKESFEIYVLRIGEFEPPFAIPKILNNYGKLPYDLYVFFNYDLVGFEEFIKLLKNESQ